jgi:fructokinase
VIVVVGEALIDLTVDAHGLLEAHLGGGPFNVARTVGRLGTPVTYIGRVSRDSFGARLYSALADDGVGPDGIVETDAPTTLAVAELDDTGAASYRFYLQGTSAPGLEPADALARLPAGATALHIGTLGLVLPPSADAVRAVAERLAGRALVLVDPNCRPGAAGDAATVRGRVEAVLGFADVVKASEDDLAWLAPSEPPVTAARGLLAGGPHVVLLTRGRDGVTIVTATTAVDVPAPPIVVVDTIGAGDAFGGAFLSFCHDARLSRTDLGHVAAVEAATRFAVAVAARTCERPGADPPWRRELEDGH